MGIGRKERKELVSATVAQLEEVLPASGKPEELVRLTTAIVQSTKKLLEGTPEELRTRSTAILSVFVVSARNIAKDPRSVDVATRQSLSNSRKAVDALVRELSSWHDERQGDGEEQVGEDDAEVVLSSLTRITSERALVTRQHSGNGGPVSLDGTEQEKDKELRAELQREQINLWKKTEPQQAPVQHGKPSEVLTENTEHLTTSARSLVEVASQKTPLPADILEPALVLTKAVLILLDLVDSIFVTRYPMRTQVHTFCCTLVENCLSFGTQSRTDDTSSLRMVTTEVPALLSAAEVMITQSHRRAQDLEGQKKMSMQRSSEIQLLDVGMVMGMKKRGPPPKPPAATEKPKEEKPFEIVCVLCTNVAVNQEDRKPMPKGTEVPLMAYSSTNILDVRRMLHTRTGIARDSIEIKMQGDDVLPDSVCVKPNNPVPYFVFNIHEPSDRELEEMKKIEKINSRPKLEEIDWSQFSGAIAIALYEYDALGDEGTLNFDEGEVVEIVEKSHDGWWRGRKEGVEGDFPASFVEEVEIPRTPEEARQLALKFRKKSPDKLSDDEGRASPGLKKLRKLQSNPDPGSPSSSHRGIFDRRVSEPVLADHQAGGRRDKKKLGLFKKRGGTVHGALPEESSSGDLLGKKSPFLSDRRKKKAVTSTSSWEEAVANCESPELLKKMVSGRPVSAPKVMTKKKPGPAGGGGGGEGVRPRRPPPPVPNPAQHPPPPSSRATHVFIDTEEMARRASGELSSPDHEREGGTGGDRRSNPRSPPTTLGASSRSPETPPEISEQERSVASSSAAASATMAVPSISPSPDSVHKSESMEELLKNLEEFDEVISSQNDAEVPEMEMRERDFATIPRSELPRLSVEMSGQRSSRSPSRTPEAVRKLVKSDTEPVENGLSQSPVAPPRRKKSRMSQKLKDRVGVFEGSDEAGSETSGKPVLPGDKPVVPGGKPAVPSTKPVMPGMKPVRPAPKAAASGMPPPKPDRDEKKRMKSRLEVMAGRQECSSSAPVSRNASPDIADSKLTKDGSASSEGLNASPHSLSKRSPPCPSPPSSSSSPPHPSSLAYSAALKCIEYLSVEDRVASETLFRSSPSSTVRVDSWLSILDRGDAPDLNNFKNTATATALLKALLSSKRLGPLIQYPLAKSMCELVKSTSPVSVLGSQLEQLSVEHRTLLKELLRLFGLIINHSDKNKTEVSDLNRMFGLLVFDRLPPAQTEQLLAYLISTCELLIVS